MDAIPHTALLFFFMLGTSPPAHAIKGNHPQIKITGLCTYYYIYSQSAATISVRSTRILPSNNLLLLGRSFNPAGPCSTTPQPSFRQGYARNLDVIRYD